MVRKTTLILIWAKNAESVYKGILSKVTLIDTNYNSYHEKHGIESENCVGVEINEY